jgi:hypothetical protein
MSKLNKNEFKELLAEWKCSLNNQLVFINEVSIKEFKRVNPDFDTSEFNTQLIGNTDYLDIISNSINSNQNHDPIDYVQQFEFYKNSIEPNRRDNNFLSINIPGENDPVSLVGKVNTGSCTATFDDIQLFQQARMFVLGKGSKNKLASAYERILRESASNDFELIINDRDWIIFYPKSIRGSITLARSFWNGRELEYDKTFNPSKGYGQNIGVMKWCTSVSGKGNMFLNYHRRKNLHMYYCIKKNMSVEDLDRKLCISFSKKNNNVKLMEGQTSVNANNSMTSEEEFKTYIGERFNVLFNDVKNPDRLEIDEKAYYESISLEQYKILRAANEDNLEDFIPELEGILAYSIDKKEIGLLALKEKNKVFKLSLAKSSNLMELDPSGELIKKLAFDKKVNVRLDIASFQDLLGADPSGELIKKLAFDKNKKIRIAIAEKQDLLGADPSGELIKSLASDANKNIRIAMSRRQDLLKLDPSGGLFKKLAADKNKDVRGEIASRQDLLEVDPSGELIKQVVFNGDEHFKTTFVSTQNILELDPSGELIKKLAFDNNIHVRLDIASFQDLLGADPSGELIKKLASDKSEFIRNAVLNRYNIDDLSKLKINTNESILREYIKYLL